MDTRDGFVHVPCGVISVRLKKKDRNKTNTTIAKLYGTMFSAELQRQTIIIFNAFKCIIWYYIQHKLWLVHKLKFSYIWFVSFLLLFFVNNLSFCILFYSDGSHFVSCNYLMVMEYCEKTTTIEKPLKSDNNSWGICCYWALLLLWRCTWTTFASLTSFITTATFHFLDY